MNLRGTLRASLSGTFLQTLPDLVTPLKGHSYLRAAVHRRGQRPPKGSGTNMNVEATAFRHLPPNSARFSYATEGPLFISTQLSTDAVSALRKVRVLVRLWKQPSAQARMQTRDASTPGKKESSVSIQTIVVLFVLV